jgi:hypothetical protein
MFEQWLIWTLKRASIILSTAVFNNISVIAFRLVLLAGADPGGAHDMIFCRKIVIFHTKYLKSFRASLRNRKK